MSECIGSFYIYNGEIQNVLNFTGDILSKGKALYEVIRVVKGVPLFLERHMERLNNSFNLTEFDIWISHDNVKDSIKKLIDCNALNEGNIKIVFNILKKEDKMSQNYAVYMVEHHYPLNEEYEKGVSTILYHGERNNPNAKIVNSDFRKAVDTEMKKTNAYEAILVDRNGIITEGSKSNIFFIKGEKVITAPLELVLPGVTRNVIIDICKEEDIGFAEERIDYRKLSDFDALFISGTSPKVLPVRNVENMMFYSSENMMVKKIRAAYNKRIEGYIKNHVVNY